MKKNKIEIVFSDEDVKHFKSNWNDLPPTIYSIFKVLKSNYCDAPLIHLIGFYGTCGANLFTRFAYMDEEINRCVKKIVVKEQELMSNVILAEIVHLPNTRLGNILSRTHMRDYEILYLSHANRMESKIINASDLLLSIREGRIFLRSKNLDKEIIPRLTNAHNYSYNAVPIYRFLCDLQKQYGRISLAFNWGYLENELNFLPRVRYKNTILSFACWKIRTSAMKYLFILEDDAQLISEVRKWRKQYMFPSKMVLVDGDNELLVDWEIPLSVRALFSLVKRREMICLREFMFTPKNCLVKDKRGKSYTNECIVAFYKNEMKNVQRTFIPGSEWIYLKLYTGEKTADDLLVLTIDPIIKKARIKGYLKKWFFIRYADPDFHLRCRILLNDIKCFEKVVGLFYNELRKLNYSQLIWKIQIDTYNRELERYGSSLIEDTESFFCVDSECVLTIIKKLNGNENYRWMIALKLIDGLLSDFGMSIEKKQKIMKEMGDMLKKEFGFNKYNSKQFNMKFRANKKYIETVLNNSFKEKDFVSLLLPIRRRTKEIMLIINSFNKKIIQERRVENLLKSYLHMMLNRLFRSKNRQHELVLYDFMFRYYSSQIAKEYYK